MKREVIGGNILIFAVLFLFALLPRIYLLNETTINPDEISWLVRGKEAFYALKQFNLDFFQYAWWNSTTENESIGWPVSLLSAISLILFGKGQSNVSINIFQDYVAGRLPIAIFSSAFIPVFYLLSVRFVSIKVALLASVLLLLDPTHIGLSRWIIHDPFLTICTFISVTTFALGVKEKENKLLLLSGLFLSLGFLTKPNGLLPVVSWLVILWLNPKNRFLNLAIPSLSFLFFTVLFWPGSWTNPVISVVEYLYRQTRLSSIGIRYYFFGQSSYAPPDWFYLFQIIVKLPLLVSIIFLIFIGGLLLKIGKLKNLLAKDNAYFVAFFAFCLLFLISISIPNIKLGARYALPLWPWIYLAAAQTFLKLTSRLNLQLRLIAIAVLICSSLVSTIKYFPENYLFYNNLIGGPARAQKYDLVGLCYGIKEAVEYIKKCYPQTHTIAILGCSGVVAPYYYNGQITTDWKNEGIVVVENSFKQLLPDEEAVKHFDQKDPIFTARLKDAVVSRIYKNNINLASACD